MIASEKLRPDLRDVLIPFKFFRGRRQALLILDHTNMQWIWFWTLSIVLHREKFLFYFPWCSLKKLRQIVTTGILNTVWESLVCDTVYAGRRTKRCKYRFQLLIPVECFLREELHSPDSRAVAYSRYQIEVWQIVSISTTATIDTDNMLNVEAYHPFCSILNLYH